MSVDEVTPNLTAAFLITSAGFAMLEVGSVRSKNAKSVLFKNMAGFVISGWVWWLWGFGLAGHGASGQVKYNFLDDWKDGSQVAFFHSFSFAGASATIVSGSILERSYFHSFCWFNVVMMGLIYPIVARFGWGYDEWLFEDLMFRDFAGSGVVHVTGGAAALAGCIILGPRLHRFNETKEGRVEVNDIPGHSPTFCNLGCYILMFGWFFFNGSSSLSASTEGIDAAARAMANTLLSACVAGTVGLIINQILLGVHDLPGFHNSLLAGMVGITAGSGYVSGWATVLIGAMSSVVAIGTSNLILSFQIDDVVDAVAVHGGPGLWGVIAVGFFADQRWVPAEDYGVFLGGDGRLLGGQIVGCIFIFSWSFAISAAYFLFMKNLPGDHFRVPKDVELLGLDFKYHEGSAWPEFNPEKLQEAQDYREAERRIAEQGKTRKRRQVTKFGTAQASSEGKSESDEKKSSQAGGSGPNKPIDEGGEDEEGDEEGNDDGENDDADKGKAAGTARKRVPMGGVKKAVEA